MKEPFDYSIVPYTFGLCAAEECPRATTCLRHIALEYAPAERVFLSIMNPNRLKAMKSACDYYRSNEKVRYARGFMRTISALTVRVADTFRYRMIEYMGRKNYYLKRRGDMNLSPVEQRRIIAVAKELGVSLDEYFDLSLIDISIRRQRQMCIRDRVWMSISTVTWRIITGVSLVYLLL